MAGHGVVVMNVLFCYADDEIITQTITFMLGGHETTSVSLCW